MHVGLFRRAERVPPFNPFFGWVYYSHFAFRTLLSFARRERRVGSSSLEKSPRAAESPCSPCRPTASQTLPVPGGHREIPGADSARCQLSAEISATRGRSSQSLQTQPLLRFSSFQVFTEAGIPLAQAHPAASPARPSVVQQRQVLTASRTLPESWQFNLKFPCRCVLSVVTKCPGLRPTKAPAAASEVPLQVLSSCFFVLNFHVNCPVAVAVNEKHDQ